MRNSQAFSPFLASFSASMRRVSLNFFKQAWLTVSLIVGFECTTLNVSNWYSHYPNSVLHNICLRGRLSALNLVIQNDSTATFSNLIWLTILSTSIDPESVWISGGVVINKLNSMSTLPTLANPTLPL